MGGAVTLNLTREQFLHLVDERIKRIDDAIAKGDPETARKIVKDTFEKAKEGNETERYVFMRILRETGGTNEKPVFSRDRIEKLGSDFFKGALKGLFEDFPVMGTVLQTDSAVALTSFTINVVKELSNWNMSGAVVDASLEVFKEMNWVKQQGIVKIAGNDSAKLEELLKRAKDGKVTSRERQDFVKALPNIMGVYAECDFFERTDPNPGMTLYWMTNHLRESPAAIDGAKTLFKYSLDPASTYAVSKLIESDAVDKRFGRVKIADALNTIMNARRLMEDRKGNEAADLIEKSAKGNEAVALLGRGLIDYAKKLHLDSTAVRLQGTFGSERPKVASREAIPF